MALPACNTEPSASARSPGPGPKTGLFDLLRTWLHTVDTGSDISCHCLQSRCIMLYRVAACQIVSSNVSSDVSTIALSIGRPLSAENFPREASSIFIASTSCKKIASLKSSTHTTTQLSVSILSFRVKYLRTVLIKESVSFAVSSLEEIAWNKIVWLPKKLLHFHARFSVIFKYIDLFQEGRRYISVGIGGRGCRYICNKAYAQVGCKEICNTF